MSKSNNQKKQQAKTESKAGIKAYSVTISGSFRSAANEVFDFSDVTGHIPYCSEKLLSSVVVARYAYMWLLKQNKLPNRVYSIRDVHIDDASVVKSHPFSFVGKDIRDMSFEELQDVATSKNIREIPLFKSMSLREAIVKAYGIYAERVNKVDGAVKETKKSTFNIKKAPALIVTEDLVADENVQQLDPNVNNMGQISISMEDLKTEADVRGIAYDDETEHAELYEKVFAGQLAS